MAASTVVTKTRWMIYGANGYTGSLAARLPRPAGMEAPILAGRSIDKIKPLAEKLTYDYRIFALDDPQVIDNSLQDVYAVVLAAGPFVHTSKAMVDACLRTKTHYLDITGEYEVFDAILARHQEALDAGVALLPGVGMDVVPTDCLAMRLKKALPSATHLQMALMPVDGGISPGTAKTIILALAHNTKVRRDGEIQDSKQNENPPPHDVVVEWDHPVIGHVYTMPLSWGDISTAYRTTGIPNIAIYVKTGGESQSRSANGFMARSVRWFAGWAAGRWMLNTLVDRFVTGPTADQNANSRVHFCGIAWDAATKQAVQTSLTTVEGYQLTALSMIAAVHKLNSSHKSITGALTPSLAFGQDYVLEFEHSAWGDISQSTLTDDFLANRKF